MSFFSIIPIIGFAFFFRNINQDFKKYDLFFSISFITFFLYLSGLIGILSIGNYLLIFFGFLFFFYFIVKKKILLDKQILSKYLIFLILSLSFFLLLSFFSLKIWDEFFWAQFTKSIYIEKSLYTANSILQNHPRYTPSIPLFQSFFQFQLENFDEKLLFFSSFIIIVSQILIFFEDEDLFIKKVEKFFYLFIFFIALFLIFSHGFLYVELYLSLGLISIIKVLYEENINTNKIFLIIPALFFVFLIKETAFIFIFMFILIIIFNNKITEKKLITTIFFFSCVLIKISWDLHVYFGGAESTQTNLFISKFIQYFVNFIDYKSIYFNSFNNYILDYGYFTTITRKFNIPDFTSLTWIIASLFLYLFCLKLINKNDLRLVNILYFFGVFYYLFVFFIDYVFWDGQPVHFNRLSSTYLVIILFLQVLLLSKNKIFVIITRFSIVFIFIFLILIYNKFSYTIHKSISSFNNKKLENNIAINNIKNDTKKIKNVIKKNDKIYFIHQASSGFERTVFNFYIHPNIVNSDSWSLGEKYQKIDKFYDDIWTSNLSLSEFAYKLKKDIPYFNKFRKNYCCINDNKPYNFLYINHFDTNFINNYHDLFINRSDILKYKFFKIEYYINKIKFVPIF